ncbi:MAG: patatin-like phospholipase family protein [Candidatus Omnitrophica bacterium]|nr:patatin-like phospholipase family protein [Candidatus Omnitrophota bacterium]
MFFGKPIDINKSFIINYAPIFSHLKRSEKNLILRNSKAAHYKKGDLIYKQGDPPDVFYCVISGRVKISRLKDSREEVLEFLTCGMYFGIISLLTTKVHSVNAEAVNDSLILRIKKDDFDFILRRVPGLAIDLSRTLSQQIRSKDYGRGPLKSNIISIYSAIKGIGRTMYAVNLAISLRKETSKRVIFLEISQSGKEVLKILNTEDIGELIDLEHSALQKDMINKFIIKNQDIDIDFLNISHNPQAETSSEQISSLLALLTNDYQYIIVDLPVQRGEFVFRALTQSDTIYIITDYDINNLKATRELMGDLFKNVDYPQEKIRVILNAKKESSKITYGEIVKLIDHDVFANIPAFWQAADRIDETSLKVVLTQSDSEYARAIRRIAREIGGVLVGLALGSGAAFGLAHIGVIKVLEREKIPIDVVAGTSIGALIGALWASGKSGIEIENIMMGYNKNKGKVFRLLFDFCLPKTSLAKGKRVTKFLRRYLSNKTFHDIKLPLKVVACNLDKREKVIFDSGNLVDAVRSSLAIPGIFKPTKSNGDLIIDGGILEPVPVEALTKAGIKKIIAVNVLPSPQDMQEGYKDYKYYLEKKKADIQKLNFIVRIIYNLRFLFRKVFFPNIFDIMVNSILTMEHVMAKEDCRKANVVIHPVVAGANWFEFFRTEALIKKGELKTDKALPQIKTLIGQ